MSYKKNSSLVLPDDSSNEFVCAAKNLPPTKKLIPTPSNITAADDGILPTPIGDVDMRFHCLAFFTPCAFLIVLLCFKQ